GTEPVPTSARHLGPPALPTRTLAAVAARAFARRRIVRNRTASTPIPPEVREGPEPMPVLDVHAAVLAALLHGGAADVSRGVGALLDIERERWDAPDDLVAGAMLRGRSRRSDRTTAAPTENPSLPHRIAELHVARTL